MITSFGADELLETLSNLSLTSAAVGALLIAVLVLVAMFFAPKPETRTPLFASIVAVIIVVSVILTGCAVYTRGISTAPPHTAQRQQ